MRISRVKKCWQKRGFEFRKSSCKESKELEGFVFSDEPYKPNGKLIFSNRETNFLEEWRFIDDPFEMFLHNNNYKKSSVFKSNGNSVIFHPTEKNLQKLSPNMGRDVIIRPGICL